MVDPKQERVDAILGEWRSRRDSGEPIEPEELLAAHPELAPELQARFEALELLEESFSGGDPAGARYGDYRVIREIGRGGMGVVYEAEQQSMGRRVALKVLPATALSSARSVRRFRREARASGRLNHTNIVSVFGLGRDRGRWYYAMELVEGRTLAGVIDELRHLRGLPGRRHATLLTQGTAATPEPAARRRTNGSAISSTGAGREYFVQVAEMVAGVAEALATAHQHGIIHRDIKPANLILDQHGNLKVMDFGLAHLTEGGGGLTLTGDVVGTPYYMSPEQAMGRELDPRTDIYSLGATLYELLTLRTPFDGANVAAVIRQVADAEPTAPRRIDRRIPKDLETIVTKALEKNPDRRYRDAGELATDLRLFAAGELIRARRVSIPGRMIRKVKRHKVLAALLLIIVVLGTSGGLLAHRAMEDAERRRNQEYEDLCNRAVLLGPFQGVEPLIYPALTLLARAIEVLPERPEAWWLRATLPARDRNDRLGDLERARKHGLAPRPYHLTRALVLLSEGDTAWEEESRRASSYSHSTAQDRLLESWVLVREARWSEAAELLDGVVEASSGVLHRLALVHRASTSDHLGRLEAALQDWVRLDEESPGRSDVRLRIAELWFRLGRREKGAQLKDELLAELRERGGTQDWIRMARTAATEIRLVGWALQLTLEAHRRHPEVAEIIEARALALRDDDPEGSLALLDDLLSRNPGNPNLPHYRAISLRVAGRYADALDALGERFSVACTCRAQILTGLDRKDEALEWVEAFCMRRPMDPTGHASRSKVLTDMGRTDDALVAVGRAIELMPGSAEYQGLRGDHLRVAGRAREALDAARMAATLDPTEDAWHSRAGVALTIMERHEEALAEYETAQSLGHAPNHHGFRAESLFAVGRSEEALKLVAEAVAAGVNFIPLLHAQAAFYAREGRVKEQLETFQEILRHDPVNAIALLSGAKCLLSLGDLEQAEELTLRATQVYPDEWFAWSEYSSCLEQTRKPTLALAAAEKCIALAPPDWLHCRNTRAWALNQTGKFEEAAAVASETLRLAAEMKGQVYVEYRIGTSNGNTYFIVDDLRMWARTHLACALSDLGRRAEAEELWKQVLLHDPDNVNALNMYGNTLGGLGRLDEALSVLEKAVKLDPEFAPAWKTMGIVLGSMKRSQEAIAAFNRAIQAGLREPLVYSSRAICLFAEGKRSEALESARAGAALNHPKWTARNSMVLNWLLFDAGHWDEAERQIREERRRFRDPHGKSVREFYSQGGKLLRSMGRHVAARSHFEDALLVFPEKGQFRVLQIVSTLKLDRLDEAGSLIEAYAQSPPNRSNAAVLRPLLLLRQGKFRRALIEQERVLELSDGATSCWAQEAVLLTWEGRLEEARRVLSAGIESGTPGTIGLWSDHLDMLLILGERELVARHLQGRATWSGDAHPGHRVRWLRALGRDAEALELAQHVASQEGEPCIPRAYALAVAGEADRARAVLAAREVPWTPFAALGRARVHAVLGELDQAREWVEKAAAAGVSIPEGAVPDLDLAKLSRED